MKTEDLLQQDTNKEIKIIAHLDRKKNKTIEMFPYLIITNNQFIHTYFKFISF
jgi:hypothetical protein